jgi:hypothetical protein
MMLNFVPLAGQLKVIAEAIIGRSLFTGEKLPDWVRGLDLLIAIIPEAKLIFRSGKAGLTKLAGAAVESAKPVDKVYRAAKAAGELSAAEVRAAEMIVPGAPPNAAQQKIAKSLEEIEGTPVAEPPGSIEPPTRTEPPARGAAKPTPPEKPPSGATTEHEMDPAAKGAKQKGKGTTKSTTQQEMEKAPIRG